MDHDAEHLQLLSIFHYVVAGLAGLFSFFPLLYTAIGGFFIWASRHAVPKAGDQPPPEVVGWVFIFVGLFFFLLGVTMAVCILLTGRSIAGRRRYWFAFVVACIECLFVPFGTALGVFTIIVLSRDTVKSSFGVGPPSPV